MPAGTLVATFGFDERRVAPALRLLAYDELVLLAGKGSLRTPGFRRLRSLEPSLQVVDVDPFDFVDCLTRACAAFQAARRSGRPARASVSGGTKILADATLVAAFQEGVEAWYFGPDPVRLPVLRGVRIVEGLSPAARILAGLLASPVRLDALLARAASRGVSRALALRAAQDLRAQGLLEQRLDAGHAIVAPTRALDTYREHFASPPTGKG